MPNSKEGYTDLPDTFFNDLADESFIEDIVDETDDDPQLNRCMEEIKVLEAKIEKKKKNIQERQNGLSVEQMLRQKALECDRMSQSRSRSRDRERRHRERRTRKSSRSRSPHGSRPRDRRHNRDRSMSPLVTSRGGNHRSRGSRSKSPKRSKRSSSTHRNLSFLEELAQKFAEQGKAFPEKDALLMGQNVMNNNRQIEMNGPPMPMDFGNGMPFEPQPMISIPNFQPQQVSYPIPAVQQPVPQQQNMFYGINPMSILAGNVPVPPSAPTNLAPFPGLNLPTEMPTIHASNHQIQSLSQAVQSQPILTENQKASIIDRCEHAIKQIRAKDNKVPIMKFLYNRTSMVVSNPNDSSAANSANKSPLQAHSALNVSFKLNSTSDVPFKPITGLKMLPHRVKNIAQALGIKSSFLFDKMRTKELNAQITDQIRSELHGDDNDAATTGSSCSGNVNTGEILIQTKTVPLPTIETVSTASQTNELKCEKCTERSRRTMVSAHTQVFLKNCSIGTQTNEKDYREPIVELLSRMTAAQLVAIKDFANIIDEPRPCREMEYTRIRERLIDIYNLSQRDADTVRAAEENQMDEVSYMDQQSAGRFRGGAGSSISGGGDSYGDGATQDFLRRSHSPRRNGNLIGERRNFSAGNFEPNNFSDDRGMIDERLGMGRGMMDERFSRMDDSYQRQRLDDEEQERQIYLEMERRREIELEMSQRRYDEQKLEIERLRLEQERRQLAMMHQPSNHPFDDDRRSFSRDTDMVNERDGPPRSFISGNRGLINRRGRGAFRGRGSRR